MCYIMTEETVKRAFKRAIGHRKRFIRNNVLMRNVGVELRLTPGQLKANHFRALAKMHMKDLGWDYEILNDRFEKRY